MSAACVHLTAYTVQQFCIDHHISRRHFYELVKAGRGPRVFRPGRRTLISAEAAADWRRQLERETAGIQPEVIVL